MRAIADKFPHVCGTMYDPEFTEDLNRMTLQVGLVGNDGVVMVSDRLKQSFEHGARSLSLTSKFFSNPHLTCCWSGDIVAEYAANAVAAINNWPAIDSGKESIRAALIAAGERGWQQSESTGAQRVNVNRKVMVAFPKTASLWLLEVGQATIANPCLDRQVAGDIENTARYFINKYAEGCQKRSIETLITLAAHVVLAAGEENPHGVDGLEVIVIPRGGPAVTLSQSQEHDLKEWFKKTRETVSRQLLRPFDYRPVTPPAA